ncbi:MAG: hypothetical protein JSV21_01300 [Nitrospirota bacterium]|nr:MAG: hypothetical protein JSV21_01300 [Nitrospirota bacterium]
MNNYKKSFLLIISLLMAVSVLGCTKADTTDTGPEVISVDQVARHPGKYKGDIWVSGFVVKADPDNGAFLLGCEDACIKLPVKAEGELPKRGKDVKIHGIIKQMDDGKLFLEAKEIVVL